MLGAGVTTVGVARAALVPRVSFDFTKGTLDPLITFTRASSATYFDSAGVLQTAANDVARFDYNPSTLAARGLLIEEQRTNSIRNNTMQGAVAGTPGTAPTNWSVVSGGGLSREITSIGTEKGISYIDIRFFGTGTSVSAQRVYVESTATVAAANAQTWAFSAYVKLVAGATPSGLFIGFDETGPGTTYIRTDSATLPLTSALTRNTYTATLSGGANVAFILPQIGFNSAIGVAVDFTLRIGLPQLEQGAFATSVIPTTTTALTRSADVALMQGANFSNWYNAVNGTIYAEYDTSNSAQNNNVLSFSDGTTSNRMTLRASNTSVQSVFAGVSGGATQWAITAATALLNTPTKAAGAYATNAIAYVRSNGTVGTDTSATIPAVDQLRIGTEADGTLPLNGHIQKISYYPTRLPNGTLQALTS